MKRIYKYRVQIRGVHKLEIPAFGKVIKFGVQKDGLYIWVEHFVEQTETQDLYYMIQGTGWEFEPDGLEHFDSVITDDGFVWHLYILIKRK